MLSHHDRAVAPDVVAGLVPAASCWQGGGSGVTRRGEARVVQVVIEDPNTVVPRAPVQLCAVTQGPVWLAVH